MLNNFLFGEKKKNNPRNKIKTNKNHSQTKQPPLKKMIPKPENPVNQKLTATKKNTREIS